MPTGRPTVFGRGAGVPQPEEMVLVAAVAHVEPGHVHPRLDKLDQSLGGLRRGTERAHDVGSSHVPTLADRAGPTGPPVPPWIPAPVTAR